MREKILFILLQVAGLLAMSARDAEEVRSTVKQWADELSRELEMLTLVTRRNEVERHFQNATAVEESWDLVIEEIARNIKGMMVRKIEAVKYIKNHAEQLSLHRKPPINDSFHYFFYTSHLNKTSDVEDRDADRKEAERMWRCSIPVDTPGLCFSKDFMQSDQPSDEDKEPMSVVDEEYESFSNDPQILESIERPKSKCASIPYFNRSELYFKHMELTYDPYYGTEVNKDYSVVRVTPNVDPRSEKVINGIRWSEGLDLTFKCNKENDPTLTHQYFGSTTGFMRFYPAVNWSGEAYNQTFDFRIRSWYLEAISSAKDIVIILDRSGSMKGNKRLLANQVVNSILDTLTDNDYVNIYTFTNTSEPLVDCFNDTLVEANEENLRLLREQLLNVKDIFQGNISLAFRDAFDLLYKYRSGSRNRRNGTICNQAIMLITEGFDFEYDDQIFKIYNYIPDEKYYRPIRMFTYLIGTEPTDAQRMKWIACANMGYYVNLTEIAEVRDKVLKYLEVLSRPINLNPDEEPAPAWTALYVDMADRRLSNWLWKKYEGNLQRDILIRYEKERLERLNITDPERPTENQTHFTRNTDHDYKHYRQTRTYKYMTSVSLPVYDRRENGFELLGVAGVDVELEYIKQLAQPHRIGVNGYAFIITNNGYVLHHPDHRTEFKPGILKPTFNRVDFTEVEVSDATVEPRKFDDAVINLREAIVLQLKGESEIVVRHPYDNMRRVLIHPRRYYYMGIGPFTLVIALPKDYGTKIIKQHWSVPITNRSKLIRSMENWRQHPNWAYKCKVNDRTCSDDLKEALLKDLFITKWFEKPIDRKIWGNTGLVLTFLATHTGLLRWKDFSNLTIGTNKHFSNTSNKGPDETYYRRSSEMNFKYPNMFVYSVPFEDFDEHKTLITASNVIFFGHKEKRAPLAAVGFQMLHKAANNILKRFKCEPNKHCPVSCVNSTWTCHVIDNDGYVILSNNLDAIGKLISKVDYGLTKHMVAAELFKEITVFDYQATCYPPATITNADKIYGQTHKGVLKNNISCDGDTWKKKGYNIKCKTYEFLRRQLVKTIPTPCDEEIKMYHYQWTTANNTLESSELECPCAYVTQHVKGTNLVLVALNNTCCPEDEEPPIHYPKEISYNLTLPCYIQNMNNFRKRHSTKCFIKNEKEYVINADNKNCGAVGVMPIE